MTLLAPERLVWLWAAGAAAAVMLIGSAAARRALARFASRRMHPVVARGRRGGAAAAGAALLAGALGLLVLALARPAWDPSPRPVRRAGRDAVFLIDVSRSMLAQDIRPSRLGRAKVLVRDVLDSAPGDRIGIIAFAGSAVVKCPLTTDYAFARLALDALEPDAVSRGGSRLGDAVEIALATLLAEDDGADSGRYRDLYLITDGEDMGSDPTAAAREAAQRGVRIVTIGLGDADEGATIPVELSEGRSGPLVHDGQQVITKLHAGPLERIAEASPGGAYLGVGTGTIQMDKVYAQLGSRAEKRRLEDQIAVKYTEGFQYVLAGALALLLLEGLVRERSL